MKDFPPRFVNRPSDREQYPLIMDGPYEKYYENGRLSIKGTIKDGLRDGVWECYHDNAQLSHRFAVKAGLFDGPYEEYDEDGQLVEEEICNKNWAWPMDNQRWNEFGESRRRFEEIDSRED